MKRLLPLSIVLLLRIGGLDSAGFVEEVGCDSNGLRVELNKTDPHLAALMNDNKTKPIVYVFGHKDRAPCGTSLKSDKGDMNYRLHIPYGPPCDVYLTNLEPNYRFSEAALVLESGSVNQVVNQVSCVYTTKVATMKQSSVVNPPPVSASTGGRPTPKVEMIFTAMHSDGSGNAPMRVRTAKIGDLLEFYLTLTPDNAYKAILPVECMFLDREDVELAQARKLTFIQNSCPNSGISNIIDPVKHVGQEVFFTKFEAFRFDNQPSVFVHCTVQVCMNKAECAPECFQHVDKSDLDANSVRFLHRHRRSPRSTAARNTTGGELENLTFELQIEDPGALQNGKSSITSCPSTIMGITSAHVIAFIALLFVVSTSSIIAIAYLLWRLKKRSKESTFELYSAAQLRSLANSSACLTDARHHPATFPPLHVHTGYR